MPGEGSFRKVHRNKGQTTSCLLKWFEYSPIKKQVPFSKIDEYQISLDGPDYVFTTVNHSVSKMDVVLDGIRYLLSLGKTVSLFTIWTKALANTLDEFISKIKESGILNNPNFTINTSVAVDYESGDVLHQRMYNNWNSLVLHFLLQKDRRCLCFPLSMRA